jgi:SAM-dependent methyltransferase
LFLLEQIDRLTGRLGRRDLRILDVGCGDGLFFERLERYGHVEGVEADGALVADPRWRGRIAVGRLGEGFEPGPVHDLVLMLDVLEHIADDVAALCAARRALRPGGRLVLTVPALPVLWSRHDEVNEHHRRYTRRGLRRSLVASGFEVEELRYFFAWAVGPLLARRWLAPGAAGKTGRRVAADYAVAVPPAPVNRALYFVSRAEQALGRLVRWPLGSSLLAVGRDGRGRRSRPS